MKAQNMRAADKTTVHVPAGQILSITAPAGTIGSLTRLSDAAGGEPFPRVAINGANLSYGPYSLPRQFAIACDAGQLTFSIDPVANAQHLFGTFVCNGVTAVTINNANIAIGDVIVFSLNTVGGTVGALPTIKTIAAGTLTVAGTASDTSIYNYAIIKNNP